MSDKNDLSQALFQSGDLIGNYRVEFLLQQNPLEVLYTVCQLATGQHFRLKTLPANVAPEKAFQDRIRYEGLLLAQLSHPNILSLIERIQGPEHCHLILEYCDGIFLSNWIEARTRNGDRVSPPDVKIIIGQLLCGLEYIHNAGFAHRRIEPANILLTKRGEIKITGFSLIRRARISGNAEGFSAAEFSELPEQWPDIYAIGAMAYHFLTGLKPAAHAQMPSKIVDRLGSGWDEFIRNCVDRRSAGCYANGMAAYAGFKKLLN